MTEAPTRVLRRTLERALETRDASTLLFEALSASENRVPHTLDEVLEVVRGPLRHALEKRLGPEQAAAIVLEIEEALGVTFDAVETQERPLDDLVSETRPDEATASFPTADRSVRVLVVAGGRGFEHRLEVALGEQRVAPTTVSSHEGLRHALGKEPPPVFLIDASDFPSIDPARLIAAAQALPSTTACVLWGAELPYGKNLARSLERNGRAWIQLALREGIEPLCDVIRSRRTSPAA